MRRARSGGSPSAASRSRSAPTSTIGREYAVAAALGVSPAELLAVTHDAVRASFASAERRAALLAELGS